jgi:hypothetical protein
MLSAQLPLKARILDECDCSSRTLTRKTSLLRKIEPIARRSSFANKDHLQPAFNLTTEASAEMIPEIVIGIGELLR